MAGVAIERERQRERERERETERKRQTDRLTDRDRLTYRKSEYLASFNCNIYKLTTYHIA